MDETLPEIPKFEGHLSLATECDRNTMNTSFRCGRQCKTQRTICTNNVRRGFKPPLCSVNLTCGLLDSLSPPTLPSYHWVHCGAHVDVFDAEHDEIRSTDNENVT